MTALRTSRPEEAGSEESKYHRGCGMDAGSMNMESVIISSSLHFFLYLYKIRNHTLLHQP